jgi:catechol 2,3-dioxygenase-like lactoylglutathione lyase family enzyme
MTSPAFPTLQSVVLDTTAARALAEFYRRLLGFGYRAGNEAPPPGKDDPRGGDWLVLVHPSGSPRLAFQQVDELSRPTWPDARSPEQLHLDLTVPDEAALREQHERSLGLGARLLLDRSDDPVERLYVYADPDGQPFCIFVGAD